MTPRTTVLATLALLSFAAPALAFDDLREQIDEAIDSGSVWLARQQKEDGSWTGYETSYPMGTTALALLTLRTCGFPRKSAVIEKGFDELRRRYERQKKAGARKTYSIAITMMALEALHRDKNAVPARPSRYGPRAKEPRVKLPPRDLAWMREMTEWMVGNQQKSRSAYGSGVWRYPHGGYDHSCTQYALLGLKSARRCGIPVSGQVFLATIQHFLAAQEKTGKVVEFEVRIPGPDGKTYVQKREARARGWGYMVGRRATGSMTAGAVGCLAIARSELLGKNGWPRKTAAACDQAIVDGLAWLGENFTVTRNPGGGAHHDYYLYALERAGILCDVKTMGGHDWYFEGARYLVGRQDRAGSWDGGRRRIGRGGPVGMPRRGGADCLNTCFALLFLKRGTVPVVLPALTPR